VLFSLIHARDPGVSTNRIEFVSQCLYVNILSAIINTLAVYRPLVSHLSHGCYGERVSETQCSEFIMLVINTLADCAIVLQSNLCVSLSQCLCVSILYTSHLCCPLVSHVSPGCYVERVSETQCSEFYYLDPGKCFFFS
jgi:hypothetical protein